MKKLHKKVVYLFAFFLQLNLAVFGQNPNGATSQLQIQRVDLKDSILIQEIKKFIQSEIVKEKGFKVVGYITISKIRNSANDIIKRYHINKNYVNFDELKNDSQFPFYSYVDSKIILLKGEIESFVDKKFSNRSKKHFQRIIEPFLYKVKLMQAPSIDGKSKKKTPHREGERIQLHGGIDVSIFINGRVEVMPSKFY
ncbi:hypothetical protein ACFOWA_00890 [Pedobacter lithocola]|uniref:POTRA domain-containing protein n=1 Tax=Pedobacter lithocola TaxID=1908239 RepID=A0ABV8P675_9SPHI